MNARKIITLAVVLSALLFGVCPAAVSAAGYDINFEVCADPVRNPDYDPAADPESAKFIDAEGKTYAEGDVLPVHVMVDSRSDNGYIYLEMYLKFDSEAFTLKTAGGELANGFSVKKTDDGPETGSFVYIIYNESESITEPSEKGVKYIPLSFVVTGKAPTGEYPFELIVGEESCIGLDKKGNWDWTHPLSFSVGESKNVSVVYTAPEPEPEPVVSDDAVTESDADAGQDDGASNGGLVTALIIALVMIPVVFFLGFVIAKHIYDYK